MLCHLVDLFKCVSERCRRRHRRVCLQVKVYGVVPTDRYVLLFTLNNNEIFLLLKIIFGCCIFLIFVVVVFTLAALFFGRWDRLLTRSLARGKIVNCRKKKWRFVHNKTGWQCDLVCWSTVDAIVIIFVCCLLRDERIHMVHVMCVVWLSFVRLGKLKMCVFHSHPAFSHCSVRFVCEK